MESEFVKKVNEWLDTPVDQRDYEAGALLMLQANRNRIMYNNMRRRPDYYATHIEYQLKKYVEQRSVTVTHQAVVTMEKQADVIMENASPSTTTPKQSDYRRGKRLDHDSLPAEIQQLYTDNLTILQRMRECHLQVRQCSGPNQACVDNDKYPFLKELIALDKKRLANWKAYDSYDAGTGTAAAATASVTAAEVESKLVRQINLNLGKYLKNPTEPKKKYLADLYAKLANPPASLTKKLTEAGVIGV